MAEVIPVKPQPEPKDFNQKVRQKGKVFLREKNLFSKRPLPEKAEIKPYWRDCLNELYASYKGCCAYLAVFFERVTGAGSVDHFVAKSQRADLAYEWSNYRLACAAMNRSKGAHNDVLDPFFIQNDWFRLELVSGNIYANASLPPKEKNDVESTISRLHLNDAGNCEMRARHYQEYREGNYTADFLRRRSPFVYAEAFRQNLL